MSLTYVKIEPKRLRDLGLNERWLQEKITDDPSILGLGDLYVIERERSQPTGGRMDFLMYDPENSIRYEIEVMLGRVDESHIIRTIEYWDVERNRFPSLEHRAVIVAEEITNRFFNVISLLNRAIPIIAIQLSVFQIEGKIVLNFVKVLDIADLSSEDEQGTVEQVDRAYWEKMSNPSSLGIVHTMISLIPTDQGPPRVAYNKNNIAVGATGRNFLWFHPRKTRLHCHMHLLFDGEEREKWIQKLDEVGIFAGPRGTVMKMRITQKELTEQEELIRQLLAECEQGAKR